MKNSISRISTEDLERLRDIKAEMEDLISEASDIVRCANKHEYERSRVYWIAHIKHALNNINPYDTTMEKTIRLLENYEDCDLDDAEDESEDNSGEINEGYK